MTITRPPEITLRAVTELSPSPVIALTLFGL